MIDGVPSECPEEDCNETLEKRHCKYICSVHGVIYDCSDPFR